MDEYLKTKDEPYNKFEDDVITRIDLFDAISELPGELATILALWMRGYNQEETARICNQSRTSVWLKRKRILMFLRKRLA